MRPDPRGVGGLRPRIVTRLAAAARRRGAGRPRRRGTRGLPDRDAGSPSTMTLIDQSPWVAPVGTFDLRVAAGTVPTDAQIVARIYVPISTQAQLERVAKGQSLGQRVESVTVPAAAVSRGSDGSLMLSYPMVASGIRSPTGFLLANPRRVPVLPGGGGRAATPSASCSPSSSAFLPPDPARLAVPAVAAPLRAPPRPCPWPWSSRSARRVAIDPIAPPRSARRCSTPSTAKPTYCRSTRRWRSG